MDGISAERITRNSLRKNYGMVLQETWLKAGTIHDNIAYGKPDASREEVIEAAKARMRTALSGECRKGMIR